MRTIQKTPYHSICYGALPKGCRMCVLGRKLVLFVTGLCSRSCYYCPLSDRKKDKDVTYANEWKIEKPDDIIKEAELCSSTGAGITGGDPFLVLERVISYIRLLKDHFGKTFHIHLYTGGEAVTKEKLEKLYDAGLDEVRFHPDIFDCPDDKVEGKLAPIKLALQFNWDVGCEMPCIPDKKERLESFMKWLDELKVNFLVLNEFEVSELTHARMLEKGYRTKDDISYAIYGSEALAEHLLSYAKKNDMGYRVHFCTAKLKDSVQLQNRILLRAKNAALSFDTITEDGMLFRGALYLPDISPKDAGYRKKLDDMPGEKKKDMILRLDTFRENILKKNISQNNISLDRQKLRLLIKPKICRRKREMFKAMGLLPALVEEYPTWDSTEIVVDFL